MERTYTLQDLLAALRRRRLLALVVGAAVLVVGLALALGIPAEYSASSVMQLEPRRLSLDFMPAQNVTPLEDRMRTVKHGVLARPVLERVIRETDLYPDAKDMDEAVDRMRRNVEVRLEGEVPVGAPALLFVVEVRGRDPQKVAKAAQLLPRYYAEMTRQVWGSQARALRETLDAQAADMSKALAAQEKRIVVFKTEHAAELPEMVEDNARAVGRAESQIETRRGLISDAEHRKQAALASVPEGPSAPGMAEASLDAAQRHLEAAEATYGPEHPDVLRARRELQEVVARRDGELDRFRKQRVAGQIARLDAEQRDHEARIAELRKEAASYQKRIDAAPRWAAELANLSRDYEVLRAKYVSTVSRRSDAAAAEALLLADDPALFRMVEGAMAPSRPSAPDRPRLFWLAVVAAIVASLGAAALAEWLDPSMRGPEDAATLGVPVLAAVPRIGLAALDRR
jgi:polysaccharide chain length determinant protein (PEP-CTERM system associated)